MPAEPASSGTAPGPAAPWSPSAVERDRRVYRRARARRSGVVAALSTLAVVGVAVALVVTSPGWPRVRETFFDGERALDALPAVLDGLWLNIRVMLVCAVLIGLLGLVVAVVRTTRGAVTFPLRLLATAYVDLFRGLPLLLVLFLLGFGAPALRLSGLPTSALFWGCCALVLTYSAYVAEVFRAGIESVHPSQLAAARSLGLSYPQSLRFVVVPQAVRNVVPALMNDVV
ncbi:MAG: ABC transporter permease subunit, partial [Phycicoccus sp.]